ncbi:MAG: hypothetical protein IJI57_12170 [Flexilinea sp.]|nr:hypothetical protein [Flexilinea sp.]
MNALFSPGDNVYFIENAIFVKEAQIVKCAAGSCVIRFTDRSGGTRLRESRLFKTAEEAKKNIRRNTGVNRQQ